MFASTFASVKNAFVTKPFVPNAYQANPSQIVNHLEDAFKAMFDGAPDLSSLKSITPRQAYAGGENIFTYAVKRTNVHLGLAYDDLKEELVAAWATSTVIILSLPANVSDEFSRIVMGFAVPLNYAYYATKHVSFDAGKFASGVAAQMHGTKLAMKKYSRRLGGEVKPVHTKQVVLSSGKLLTAQLTSDGTVTMFRSYGDADVVAVSWHETRFAVKVTKIVKNDNILPFLKPYHWNEDEFNSVFVKLVAEHATECTEELANAALGAKPMTKSSVVKEFATKAKVAAKESAKEQAPAEPAKEEPAAPAAGASVAHAYPAGTVFTETTEAAAKSQSYSAGDSLNAQSLEYTEAEQAEIARVKGVYPNAIVKLTINNKGVRVLSIDVDHTASEVKMDNAPTPEQVSDFEGDTINPAISEGIDLGRNPSLNRDAGGNLPEMKVGEDGHISVDMGEVKGIPVRQNKPCNDRNAEKVLKKVVGSKATHLKEDVAANLLPDNTIAFYAPTNTILVKGKRTSYSIVCDMTSDVRPVFKLIYPDLKALGLLLDYDFGRCQDSYCITSNLLMTRLLGNGNTLAPLVFDEK